MFTNLLKLFGIYPVRVAIYLKSGAVLRRDCGGFKVSTAKGKLRSYEISGGKPGQKFLYAPDCEEIAAIVVEKDAK